MCKNVILSVSSSFPDIHSSQGLSQQAVNTWLRRLGRDAYLQVTSIKLILYQQPIIPSQAKHSLPGCLDLENSGYRQNTYQPENNHNNKLGINDKTRLINSPGKALLLQNCIHIEKKIIKKPLEHQMNSLFYTMQKNSRQISCLNSKIYLFINKNHSGYFHTTFLG